MCGTAARRGAGAAFLYAKQSPLDHPDPQKSPAGLTTTAALESRLVLSGVNPMTFAARHSWHRRKAHWARRSPGAHKPPPTLADAEVTTAETLTACGRGRTPYGW